MAKPTFTVGADVVRISIQGVPNPKGFPYVPDDMGLVGEFLEAIHRGSLPRPTRSIQSGGGVYEGYFLDTDVDQIIEWLKGRADFVYEHPKPPK